MTPIDWKKFFYFFILVSLALALVSADELISADLEDKEVKKEIDASLLCDKPHTHEETYISEKYPVTTNFTRNFFNNVTMQQDSEIRFITYEAVTYATRTIIECPPEKAESLIIDDGKEQRVLECDVEKYTCSFQDGILTKKDLSAGGTWSDRDLNTCWNPGVPCKQEDYTKDIYEPEVKVEITDKHKEAIK